MKFLILIVCVATAYGQLNWNDCASDNPNRMVKFNKLYVNKMPVEMPGKLTVEADVQITKAIQGNLDIKAVIERKLFGVYVKIPCAKDIGSCTYSNGCEWFKKGFAKAKELLMKEECPDLLKALGLTCAQAAEVKKEVQAGTCPKIFVDKLGWKCADTCPIPSMDLKLPRIEVDLPALPSIAASFAQGDYRVKVEMINKDNGSKEACLYLTASLKKGNTGGGWMSGRR